MGSRDLDELPRHTQVLGSGEEFLDRSRIRAGLVEHPDLVIGSVAPDHQREHFEADGDGPLVLERDDAGAVLELEAERIRATRKLLQAGVASAPFA
jgi:hypothetical protein